MTLEIAIFLLIILLASVAFITEFFSVDKVAFLTMSCLLMAGLLTPTEAIAGFSNSAVITILMLMMITSALEVNNSMQILAKIFIPFIKRSIYIALPCVMLLVGGMSAFVSTTAVVLLLVKIMPELVEKYDVNQSSLMLPISYAGILGGSCTLVGTSTNLIVNQIAVQKGLEGFELFDISGIGIISLLIGVILITLLAPTLFSKNPKLVKNKILAPKYICVVRIKEGNKMIARSYKSSKLYKDKDSRVLQINRRGVITKHPFYWKKFRLDDEIMISTNKETILELKSDSSYEFVNQNDNANSGKIQDAKIIELLILPGSGLIGKSFNDITPSDLDGGLALGISKHRNLVHRTNRLIESKGSTVRIDVGDKLLIKIDPDDTVDWAVNNYGEILNQIEFTKGQKFKQYFSLAVLTLVLGLIGFGVTDILKSTIIGVSLLIITRSFSFANAYENINWQIIFLLVFLFPIGTAMANSGADEWLSGLFVSYLGQLDTRYVLTILFLVTMLISGVISNNATAIVIAPLAIYLAGNLDVSPYPFLVAVMIASNFSFFTPIGYQTNTIVYGMNLYKFKDFLILGGILSFVLWISCVFLIPFFFPF